MTRYYITILFLLIGLNSVGQSIRIDTLQVPESERYTTPPPKKMIFPVIRTGNPQTDSLLNADLKNEFTNYEHPDLPTDSTLIYWTNDQIIYLDFEVTYNKNGILSLHISAEGCGAYCTGWTRYFNYSTVTGKTLRINEIVDTSGKFKERVYADKDRQYNQQKRELKEMLSDPQAELDENTYNWALQHYLECEECFNIETFALYSDHLEIIEKCYVPNAIKNLIPLIELKYNYADIKEFLKI